MSEEEFDGPLVDENNDKSDQDTKSKPAKVNPVLVELREKLEQFPSVEPPSPRKVAAETTAIYNSYNTLVGVMQEVLDAAQDAIDAAEAETAETRKSYNVAIEVNRELADNKTVDNKKIADLEGQLRLANVQRDEANKRDRLAQTMIGVVAILNHMSVHGPFEVVSSFGFEIVVRNIGMEAKLKLDDNKHLLYVRYVDKNHKPVGDWHYINQVVGKLTVNDMLALMSIMTTPVDRMPNEALAPFQRKSTQVVKPGTNIAAPSQMFSANPPHPDHKSIIRKGDPDSFYGYPVNPDDYTH